MDNILEEIARLHELRTTSSLNLQTVLTAHLKAEVLFNDLLEAIDLLPFHPLIDELLDIANNGQLTLEEYVNLSEGYLP